jgi:TRAP-type C4-dicarboxylate transport system substrate-binding protein
MRMVLLLVALLSARAAAQPAYEMKLATVAPADTPWSELLTRYKKQVEEKSGKRIVVKVFLGGVLGDENESVLKCKRGQVQAVGGSTGAMATLVPELNVVEIPFLFRNYAEADWIVDNVLTARMDALFRSYGFAFGFWSENGFRHLGTKDKPVKSLADLKGKKIRTQESPVHLQTWQAFGAAPVPIPTTEVLTALGTNTVDGFDQALLYTIATGWHKSIKSYTLTSHIYQPALIAFNQKWFDALPADLQKILVEEGRAIQAKGRARIRAIMPELTEILKGDGVAVHELSPAESKAFEQAALGVRPWFKKTQGKRAVELLDAVEKELQSCRAGKKCG